MQIFFVCFRAIPGSSWVTPGLAISKAIGTPYLLRYHSGPKNAILKIIKKIAIIHLFM